MKTAHNTAKTAGEPIRLNEANFAAAAKGLPAKARMVLSAAMGLAHGSLQITVPDGRTFLVGGRSPGPDAKLVLHNWNLPGRAFSGGTIGVAESYMDGDWESPDVTTFLELFVVNVEAGEKVAGGANWLLGTIQRVRHWLNRNSRTGSKRNISAHYDLGNEFYSQWLDPSMTYSSALYETGANDLESAQAAKYRALARDTGIGPNDHVLEIGCGWGGFAEFAAREIGCKVTGLTISKEQFDFARERIARAGLADRVEFKLQDYRDEKGRYDRIASIEMFEAVGERFWPTYFRTIRERLQPGGAAGLQLITIADRYFEGYRRNVDFIQAYIFPGGMLPSPAALDREVARAGLKRTSEVGFGLSYARTLALWNERFQAAWPRLRDLGFDERFRRIWTYYLASCEASFLTRSTDVIQTVLRPA